MRVFSLPHRRLDRTIDVSANEVFQVAISAANAYFATAADDGALTLFRLSDASLIVV